MDRNIDVDQSVRAIFAMCSDVTRLVVHGYEYFYFNAKHKGYLRVIKYILSSNDCESEFHKTSYYDNYETKRLIVRMPVANLDKTAVIGFKRAFNEMYSNKSDILGLDIFDKKHSSVLFSLWSGAKKARLINNIADRTR